MQRGRTWSCFPWRWLVFVPCCPAAQLCTSRMFNLFVAHCRLLYGAGGRLNPNNVVQHRFARESKGNSIHGYFARLEQTDLESTESTAQTADEFGHFVLGFWTPGKQQREHRHPFGRPIAARLDADTGPFWALRISCGSSLPKLSEWKCAGAWECGSMCTTHTQTSLNMYTCIPFLHTVSCSIIPYILVCGSTTF